MLITDNLSKIVLIAVYFGKFPRWINLYIKTCKYNPTIDWIIFCNDRIPQGIAENVKFINISLNDFITRAERKTETKIPLKEYRKISDLKPAYGAIFEDYIKNYDFWGHVDLDIMWGDIRKFITEEALREYQIISATKYHICGHFTLYRNCEQINNMFKINEIYKNIFKDKKYKNFDEIGDRNKGLGMDQIIRQAEKKNLLKVLRQNLHINDFHNEEWDKLARQLTGEQSAEPDDSAIKSGTCYWNDGKVFHKETGQETMYFHFQFSKDTTDLPGCYRWYKQINRWEIDQNRCRLNFSSFYYSILFFLETSLYLLVRASYRRAKNTYKRCREFFAKKACI
ncbi:MAG: hypothetical protein NG737_01385 [Omnitrophica bacterium]|nr:hypothetical protein [Candidatus Omnitrophota bacterium]